MLAYHLVEGRFAARPGTGVALSDDAVRVRVEEVCVTPHDLERCADCAPGGGLVGVVVECGSAASAFQDARVLVTPVQACGECARCRRGLASVCVARVLLGADRDGGCAEEVVASARWLTRLHGSVDIAGSQAALAAGPALHAYGLYCRAGVAPGDRVIAVGEGAAKAILCAVAESRGAKLLAFTGRETPDAVAESFASLDLRDKPQHIFVFDAANNPASQAVFRCAAPGSVIAVSGATGHIDFAEIAARELTILGQSYPHPDLMPELVAMIAKGELVLTPFVEHMPIAQADEQAVHRAHASGRCLVLSQTAR